MLFRDDGTSVGSVGGGCVEAEVWQQARKVIESGKPALLSYQLTAEDAENEGLICGGSVDIFIEPIMSDPRLVILGAGHLGRATASLAKEIGFEVIVVDDRDSFANTERFPEADEVIVAPFSQALDDVEVNDNTFILVVTRGHQYDQQATETSIKTSARYVGLVGSRRKIKIIVEALLEKSIPPEAFAKLYAPIGIDIGSETPEEIAVSVVAELIAVRKGVHQRSGKQNFILKSLNLTK
jgi:xanthine dehydrogenase accessory factor